MEYIVLVCHCILNDYTRVFKTSVENYRALTKLVYLLRVNGYRIVQLPCPELMLLGRFREPMTREEYRERGLETVVKEIVSSVEDYLKRLSRVYVRALIGIKGSPSCGITETHIKDKGKREKGCGLLMEHLIPVLDNMYGGSIEFLEYDFRKPIESINNIVEKLELKVRYSV